MNCMTGLGGMTKEEIRDMLNEVGIDPARRAETLTIEEFATVANHMKRGIDQCQN